MRLQDYDLDHQFQATVVSSERISPGDAPDQVREIVLELDGAAHLDLKAGMSLGVLAPGREEFGEKIHFRLYTVADLPEKPGGDRLRVRLCVRRCTFFDDFSGDLFEGPASHYLCGLAPGDFLTVTGPYGIAFKTPGDPGATLILIGAGTGIAPFRAFLKHLYREADFRGRVILFHGGRTGLELLYMNEERDDIAQYYDKDTFEAIAALGKRPDWSDDIDWGGAIESRGEELWELLSKPNTFVYVAGVEAILSGLDAVFARVAGSKEVWADRKDELQAEKRWVELIY